MFYTLSGFLSRFVTLFSISKYNYIFIHREATPLGPPWFEYIASNILNKKIIYDFDDAIWLPDKSEVNKLGQLLKNPGKVKLICKWSYKISVGNKYLAEFASQHNQNVVIIPTTLDTEYHKPVSLSKAKDIVTVGWTGTHSTIKYLFPLFPVIKELQQDLSFDFLVICNIDPEPDISNYKFIKWAKATEIKDLNHIDIGIMPLTDDPWSRGKCGFKALQYLSLGKPAVVSPIGVNKEIITHGKEGFFANNQSEWKDYISELIQNSELRIKTGKKGVEKVKSKYSVIANKERFLSLFT
ncbi:glycosyltransferase [Mangrovivirga cuniculi]|uniref:glycosyltransferase n=1 Tax=Mangrovivirga cuniculi TaxID=2715131 RepID=UPI0015862FF1|nr:glycosyltransferase [Mangrovivirga cuniculi]